MTKKRDKARQVGGRAYYESMGWTQKAFFIHPDLWYLLTVKGLDKGFKSVQSYLVDVIEREVRAP